MKNKKEQGITLIALVITIVILLILSGISISALQWGHWAEMMVGLDMINLLKVMLISVYQIYRWKCTYNSKETIGFAEKQENKKMKKYQKNSINAVDKKTDIL